MRQTLLHSLKTREYRSDSFRRTSPLVDKLPLPTDAHRNLLRYVTHTLQNQSVKLSAYTELSKDDLSKFKRLMCALGDSKCKVQKNTVLSDLLSFFETIGREYTIANQESANAYVEREVVFRTLNACIFQIKKLMFMAEGNSYVIFPEKLPLENMIGNVVFLVGISSYRYSTPEPIFLNADSVDTFLLFENLLSNSKRACELHNVQPHIEIIAFHSDKYPNMVEITVKDNGIGFTPGELLAAEKQRQFSTKEQMDSELHGIGLTHCKFIVQQHGGLFSISSIKGHGAEIHLTLPVAIE